MPWDGIERRREKRMPDNFQPQTSFEGYVAANLENIKEQLKNLPCPENFKRLNKCENDIANIKGKATIIGAIGGLLAGSFIAAFKWIVRNGK